MIHNKYKNSKPLTLDEMIENANKVLVDKKKTLRKKFSKKLKTHV